MRARHLLLIKPVEPRIVVLRSQRVMLDFELAELYGVQVKRLNEQVKRNAARFPKDFMFKLSACEDQNLRSHFATSSSKHGGRRRAPFAFTEHGAIMAATVLNSKRAIEMSVFVVRAFVRLREMINTNRKVTSKLVELERRLKGHDAVIDDIIDAIRDLMEPPPHTRRIGFRAPSAGSAKVPVAASVARRRL